MNDCFGTVKECVELVMNVGSGQAGQKSVNNEEALLLLRKL